MRMWVCVLTCVCIDSEHTVLVQTRQVSARLWLPRIAFFPAVALERSQNKWPGSLHLTAASQRAAPG